MMRQIGSMRSLYSMYKYHWPTIGITAGLCLFVVAAMYYPGGTMDSASTVGYSLTHNYVSALFQPQALNGAANPARNFAILALLLLCVSLGMMFWRIATEVRSHVHKKAIEIGGIGSAVYGVLVATPMHDLMVSLGLLFNFAALFAITHMLYIERRSLLFGWGAICIALLLVSAAMYYGNVLYGLLPVLQKASFIACIGWLVSVYYTHICQERESRANVLSSKVV